MTVLQPSLHTITEYLHLILDDAEARGVPVEDLQEELREWGPGDDSSMEEVLITRLNKEGHVVHDDEDVWIVHEEGEHCEDCQRRIEAADRYLNREED